MVSDGLAADALRRSVEARIALWRHEAEPDAEDDGDDRAGRDAVRMCAHELAADVAIWQEQARDFAAGTASPGADPGDVFSARITELHRELTGVRREMGGTAADRDKYRNWLDDFTRVVLDVSDRAGLMRAAVSLRKKAGFES